MIIPESAIRVLDVPFIQKELSDRPYHFTPDRGDNRSFGIFDKFVYNSVCTPRVIVLERTQHHAHRLFIPIV
jgi:hypothetical protein